MQRQRIVPGGNTGLDPYTKSQRTIAKLRQKLTNLEDLQKGSLIRNDIYKYLVKPVLGDEANRSGTGLNQLRGPLKQVGKSGRSFGSPQYTWFLNAATQRVIDSFLLAHAKEIFGRFVDDQNNNKALAGAAGYTGADGVPGYLKKRCARLIDNWWMYNRLQNIEGFKKITSVHISSLPGANADYQDALNAFKSGKSVGQYRNGRKSTPSFSLQDFQRALSSGTLASSAADLPITTVSSSSQS